MTVSAAPALAGPFDGNDVATTFPFDFKIFADSDLRVVLRDTLTAEYLLTLDVDYSVSMNPDQNADPGGTITYPLSGSPLATGERLTVTTDLELSQQTVFTNLGKFFPATVEDTFDRLTMLLRQIQAESVRAIRVPVSLSDVLTDLPTPVPGAGLVWNEDGTALVNGIPSESLIAISSFMANVIQAVDAAEARSDIGAAADTAVVKLTGDQTIAGVKTFSSSPVIPAATTSTQATNKGQMDTAISTVVSAAVAPATIAPTLFVETSPRTLSGLSAVEWAVPSWARCITVIVVDASGAASGVAALRIGTSTIETTGYTGCCTEHSGNTRAANSTLWNLVTSAGAGDSFTFFATIQRSHNNYWVYESSGSPTNSSNNMTGCGQKSLSGALQTVQLLITAGDAFDSGVATLYYR